MFKEEEEEEEENKEAVTNFTRNKNNTANFSFFLVLLHHNTCDVKQYAICLVTGYDRVQLPLASLIKLEFLFFNLQSIISCVTPEE